jgi:crotonobetaine/carnitine-CoA ligase
MTTFHDLLRSSAAAHGGQTALLIDDARVTYAQLLARAETLAAELAGRGIGPGDHVAVIMDNSLECVLAWLASSLIGCTEIPINPQYRGDLLHYLLDDGEVTAVIADAGYLARVLEIADRLPRLRTVLVNGAAGPDRAVRAEVAALDFAGSERPFAGVDDAGERVILYTSGTTGPSKGVMHSQAAMLGLARYNAQVLGYGADDRLLNFFPLFHQNARYTGVVPALCVGASIRIERKLSTSTFWQTCERDGITAFNYLGSVLRMILNATDPDRRAGSHSVRKAFGAGAPADVWSEFEERLGIALYETYGLSEAPMATLNVPGPARPPRGSIGRASELFAAAIVDVQDNMLPAGSIGEIVLRPRRPDAFMLGYHNQPEATVAAVRNLWFHSGDRGFMSPEGDLYFEERAKDSIRRRGENISAWEVESVIEQHPGVAEAAVYGLPCADADEEVAASIIAAGDADLAAIHRFARERLPAYAVPTLMRLASDLPRTATAKVRKEELRGIPREQHVAMAGAGAGSTEER